MTQDTDTLLAELLADQSVEEIVAALGLDMETAKRVRAAALAKMPLRFWYIGDDNGPDDDHDLIVAARTRKQALAVWRKYYALTEEEEPNWAGMLPDIACLAQCPQAIAWGVIKQAHGRKGGE